LKVRCGLAPERAATIAVGADAEKALERDSLARKDAGLEATWLGGARLRKEIGADRGAGLFTTGALTLDPYRACVGLARAAAGRGCEIFEMSPVGGVRRRADEIDLRLASGTATARVVILATGSPAPLAPKLARHVRPMMMHHVVTPPLPAALRKAMGARGTVVRLAGVPARRLRWTDHRVLFSGGDHAPVPERARERAVVQRTGQLMYELSLVYPAISGVQPELGWDTALSETLDGLPFNGPHRAYPRHLFAVGADRAGAAGAWLAARLLVRHVTGALDKGDELFGFARVTSS
jgi:glycine/D-amino acid oxidase-like deaminating enzyme